MRSLPTLRPLPVALLVLAAVAPGAHAQAAEPVVQQAAIDITQAADLGTLGFVAPSTSCGGGGNNNPGSHFSVDPAAGSFSFRENSLETACAEARLNLTVPAGAEFFVLNFTADRTIQAASDVDVSPLPPVRPVPYHMPQYLRILGDGGFERSYDYYDDTAGGANTTAFGSKFAIPPLRNLTVVWHFEDQGAGANGQQQQSPSTGQSLNATVSGIRIGWPLLPLAVSPAVNATPYKVNDVEGHTWLLTNQTLRLDLPPAYVPPASSASTLRFAVVAGPKLVDVAGPRGDLNPSTYFVVEGNQRTLIVLTTPALAAGGPGAYSFGFQHATILPAPPPPAPPSHIYPFYLALALLPAVAAVLALQQAMLYVRQAEGPYRRAALTVLILVAILVAYYVLLALYSFLGVGLRRIATLPLGREPLLIYVQFVLQLVALAAAALLISRSLIGVMRRDLAERARKEDQLRRSNDELERFAYVASHDLQEPLRKVAGFTALLQKRYGSRLDKDADEIIQYAVDGATRMQMLIKDILAYSRVGSKELQRVPVDVGDTMQLVVADLGEPIRAARAEVSWGDLPTVRVDASQMRQVLQNLVENAIKYRHARRRPRVEVRGWSEDRQWHFTVSDNGIGIPADKHEEIFGIFRRLHGQELPGTGIGLAVTKAIVEAHGGTISAGPAEGGGTCFTFVLPVE